MKQITQFSAAVCGLALLLFPLTPAAAQARKHMSTQKLRPGTLAWVLHKHRVAGGAAPVKGAEHTNYTLTASGLSGSLDEYSVPPQSFRVELTLGPLHMINADDGVQAWEQDSTGNVRIIRGPELTEARAAETFSLDTYDPLSDTSGAHVTLRPTRAPDGDYVVDATPRGGTVQTMYINPSTFLIDRMEMHEAGITGTVAITSYRNIDGDQTPAHLKIGYAGIPVTITADLQSASYSARVSPAIFRVPAEARDFVFLDPKDQDSTTIPFELQTNEIVVPVSINGRTLHFILDSGAASSFITSAAAQGLGLDTQGNVPAVGYGGAVKSQVATHTTVDVAGRLRLKGQLLYVVDLPESPSFAESHPQLDGALGYDIFARMVVRVDYRNKLLTLSAPGSATLETGKTKGKVVPIKLENHTPTVEASVDGRQPARFIIDTGDNSDVHLYSRYAAAQKLENKSGAPGALLRMGLGVGGMVAEISTPGHRLTLGGQSVTNIRLATIRNAGISDISEFAGGIGNTVLSRFLVTFDYPDNELLLAPPAAALPPPAAPEPSRSNLTASATTGDLSLDDLLAHHLVALGGEEAVAGVHSTRMTQALSTGGASGTVISAYSAPDREYEEDLLGVVKVVQGYNGKVGWHIDGNGGVRPLADDEQRDLRNQIYFDSNSYVIAGPGRMPGKLSLRPARDPATGDYIVDVLPDGGKPSTIYFDPKTYMIVREEHKEDAVLTTTYFYGYHAFGGVQYPTIVHVTNGTQRYDMDIVVTKLETNVPLPQSLFDPPAPSAKAFSFTTPKAVSASTYFDVENGEIVLPVVIDGHPERLLFDSGASSTAISKQLADSLNLKEGGVLEAMGYGGSADLRPVAIGTIEIPHAVRLTGVTGVAVTLPMVLEGFTGGPVGGLLGYDLLSKLVVRVDFARDRMTFIDPDSFHPTAKDGTPLPVNLDNDVPTVDARLDDLPSAHFLLDTGDFSTLRLFEPYITNEKLDTRYPGGVTLAGGGIAGISSSRRTTIDKFAIAGASFQHVPADFSLDPKGGTSELNAGSLGEGLLSHFVVTFDFPHGLVYFAPGANANKPF
ncbi:MAG: aspartyl protease family protein [Capsulimonadaceae bacterium]